MDDRRRQRTQRLLYEALVYLSNEKGFDAVTVVDIAECAAVNRATFYRHYRDKFDMIEQIFREGAKDAMRNLRSSARGETVTPQEVMRGFELLFRHFAEHRSLYGTLLGRRGSPWFESWLRRYWTETADRWVHMVHRDGPHAMPTEVVSVAAVHTLVGTVTWWLEDDLPCHPADLARWYVRFLSGGLPCALDLDMTVGRPA